MAQIVRHAAGAIALRRLAIRILGDQGRDITGEWDAALALPDAAWRLFLGMEQCASWLSERVTRSIPRSRPAEVLASYLRNDAQLTLSARLQLGLIAQIAREHDWQIVVVKGGAAALDGTTLHLLDIDVLIRPEDAAALSRELALRVGDASGGNATARHLAPMGSQLGVPIEIHTNIDNRWVPLTATAWSRVRPAPGHPGLWRLDPRDHLLHQLGHAIIDHPERRGRLRETLLIRQALRECGPEDVEDVARLLAKTPYAAHLDQQLRFSRDLGDAPDPFETAAFARFWFMAREKPIPTGGGVRNIMEPTVWLWIIGLASGWSNRQWVFDCLLATSEVPSKLRFTAWLERRAGLLGRALRIIQRAAHFGTAFILAWPLTFRIRRAARRVGIAP